VMGREVSSTRKSQGQRKGVKRRGKRGFGYRVVSPGSEGTSNPLSHRTPKTTGAYDKYQSQKKESGERGGGSQRKKKIRVWSLTTPPKNGKEQ